MLSTSIRTRSLEQEIDVIPNPRFEHFVGVAIKCSAQQARFVWKVFSTDEDIPSRHYVGVIEPSEPEFDLADHIDTTIARERPNETIDNSDTVDERIFLLNRRLWLKERGATSSVSEIINCRSYQAIIAMGDKVVPLILKQLEMEGDDPDHWFYALSVITGADPITDEIRGDMKRMAEAWLIWGKSGVFSA